MGEEKEESLQGNVEILTTGRRRKVRWSYGLEPGVFMLYFAFNLTNAILQNQLLKQTCLQLGYNDRICSNLNTDNETKAVEEEVQPHVANINSSILVLNSIIPAIYSLLLGSWTDKYGRKKVLMMSFTGYTSTIFLVFLFTFLSDNVNPLSPWYFIVAELPMTVMGGWPTLDIAICCYVTDLSDEKSRSFRLGLITFLNFLSNFSAYFSSSFILEASSASIVFVISFCIATMAFIYTILVVEESIFVVNDVNGFKQITEIFSIRRVKEIFQTLFQRRPFFERRLLWCIMTIVTLVVFTMHGNGTVNYLFVREKFEWSLRQWTIFDSINTAITVGGLFFGLMILKKVFKISDMKIGILSLVSAIIDATFKAFASQPYQLYLSSGFGMFRLLATPLFRSIMSNILPHEEIGKIYSATTAFEALSGIGAGPLYSNIYNRTFLAFPGAFHLITSCVFLIDLIIACFVRRWKNLRGVFMQR